MAAFEARCRTRPYPMYCLVELVLGNRGFFAFQPDFGRCVITSLSRVSGMPMGIVASNPRRFGGVLDHDG